MEPWIGCTNAHSIAENSQEIRINSFSADISKPCKCTLRLTLKFSTLINHCYIFQASEITTLMADALLVSQYNILGMGINLDAVTIDVLNVNKEAIRIGQLFNRIITLLWDCFMVCGLKRFIVMLLKSLLHRVCLENIRITIVLIPQQLDWYDGPYFNQLYTQFQQSNDIYNRSILPIRKYRLYAANV